MIPALHCIHKCTQAIKRSGRGRARPGSLSVGYDLYARICGYGVAWRSVDTRGILKVFAVMFSARTALDYREQCFGGQAQSLVAARC